MSETGRPLAPGEYWYEDIAPGDYFETGHLVVTEAHIVAFAGLSGDFFDVHMDDEFARGQGFPGRIAHGLLVLSLADGLKNRSPVRIMGTASLGWNWRFQGPVVAGDRIGVRVEVEAKRLSATGRGLTTLLFTVRNQHGSVAQQGTTLLVTRRREQEPVLVPVPVPAGLSPRHD